MQSESILKDVILGEIGGKNAAIHAYDGIIWKVRSGFLVLVFSGWSILLKSMGDGSLQKENTILLVSCMFLISLAISIGGWMIDRNYVRRIFKVILALNKLMDVLKKSKGDTDYIPVKLLKIVRDDGDCEYVSRGYKQALHTGMIVFFVPPVPFAIIVYMVWYWLKKYLTFF